MTLRKALEVHRDQMQQTLPYKGHRYQGMADLLLAHGTFFTGRELPEQYRHLRGPEQRCHSNSMAAAIGAYPELRFFTGVYMVVGSKYLTHSWCVAPDDGVVELTLWDRTEMDAQGADPSRYSFRTDYGPVPWVPPAMWAYCGVEYEPEWANKYMDVRGFPLLDPIEAECFLPTDELPMFKRQYDPAGFAYTEPDDDALEDYYHPDMADDRDGWKDDEDDE